MIKGETRVVGRMVEYRPRKRMEYIPGQMILRVKEQAVGPHLAATGLKLTAAHARNLPENVSGPIEYLRKNAGLKRVEPLFSTRRPQLRRAGVPTAARAALAVASSVADSSNEDLRGINLVEVDPKKVNATVMKALRDSKAVDIIEPMPARWVADAEGGGVPAPAGVDPMQNLQWGLRAINWFAATLPDARQVQVGVMDTGIDQTHPDLKKVASDANYFHEGTSARDLLGHGTHVSGIIAAIANNDVGIAGVARCTIVAWKIFADQPASDGEFYVDGDAYLRALGRARDSGVRVVNLSIGGTASSRTEELLFRRLESGGVTVAAAMGNEFQEGDPTEYPGAYPGVLAVGAVAENLRRSVFSNTGKHIGLVAPGSNILSTLPMKASPWLPETEYASWSGTSMATPYVTGVAALVAAANPGWGPAEIKKRLTDTARKLPIMKKKKWTPSYGAGLLDVARALA